MKKSKAFNEEKEEESPKTDSNPSSDEAEAEDRIQASSEESPKGELESQEGPEESYDELNDRYMRLRAEYDNFRKRTQKEKKEFFQFATADLMEKLLPILDSMDRGIEFNEKADSLEAVKEGLVKVHRLLWETLEKEGLAAIDEVQIPMDLNLHMAVFMEDRDDVEDHTVLEVFQKGYQLKEKVLRPAKVKVSKNEVEVSVSPVKETDSEPQDDHSSDAAASCAEEEGE